MYHIAKLAGVKFTANMNLTSVDPPEVIRFVRTEYPSVIMIKPKMSIYEMAKKKCIMPTRIARWCCQEYKEMAGAGKVTLIGIRHEESAKRKMRNEVEISNRQYSGDLDGLDEYRKSINITNASEERTLGCIHGKETLMISPIIQWTVQDVWEFLNKVVCVKHCCLYDEGNTRIGCLCCPMSQPKQKLKEIQRYPHIKRNWIKSIQWLMDNGKLSKSKFTDAETYFDWWISGKSVGQFYADEFLQTKLNFKE